MTIEADVIQQQFSSEVTFWPLYLNCPYCPAQATPVVRNIAIDHKQAKQFVCPAAHVFYVHAQR